MTKDAQEFFEQGNDFVNEEELEKALISYNNALEIDDTFLDALIMKGLVLSDLEKYQDSLECFNKVLSIDKVNELALYHKGIVLYSLNKNKEAAQVFTVFINESSEKDELYISALYYKAMALIDFNEFEEMLELFEEAVKLDSDFIEAQEFIPLTLMDMGKFQEALERTDKIIEIIPDYEGFWNIRGKILRHLNQDDEALKSFEKAIKINKDDYDSWLQKGLILKDLGKEKEVLDSYKKFVEIVEKNQIEDQKIKAKRVKNHIINMESGKESVKVEKNPERSYWTWITKSDYFLEPEGIERESLNPRENYEPGDWWTCHKDTKVGDLILMYRAGSGNGRKYQDIKYLIMAKSDAYPISDDEYAFDHGWAYGCEYQPIFKFENSLKLNQIKNDPYLDEWNAKNANFMRAVYKTEKRHWNRLIELLKEKNPNFGEFMEDFKPEKLLGKFKDEAELEEALFNKIDSLKKFGFDLEIEGRQVVCQGSGGRIDLLTKKKNNGEQVVIELKVVPATRNTFGQISEYIGWATERRSNGNKVSGIVISKGHDNSFKYCLNTNPNIQHLELSDVLAELGMKLK